MALDLAYFAWVRERIGRDGERVDPPAPIGTVAALIDWLAARGEPYASALAERERLRYAIDGRFTGPDAAIGGAGEVAIFPPVTGG